jgi:hypothetical protein
MLTKFKNKDSQTLRNRDEVTRGTGLAPPLCTVQQCRAWVRLRSQAEPMGWLVQLPCLRYFIFDIFDIFNF